MCINTASQMNLSKLLKKGYTKAYLFKNNMFSKSMNKKILNLGSGLKIITEFD